MELKRWEAAFQDLAERARTDPGFHALCRREPARAFRQVSGFDLPAGLTLRFAEAQPGEMLVPLPPFLPGPARDELSDAALGELAGGITSVFAVPIVTLVAAAVIVGVQLNT